MFNQIFSKKVVVPFFQFVGIIAIFTFIVFPGLTAADTIVNIFSSIIGFFTMLALFYFVTTWFTTKENEPGETELDYVPLPKKKSNPKQMDGVESDKPFVKTRKKNKSTVKIDVTNAKSINEVAGIVNPIAEGRVKVSVETPKVKRKTNKQK
jgi:energy-coupling factor transporter transmembrane protein EcfT